MLQSNFGTDLKNEASLRASLTDLMNDPTVVAMDKRLSGKTSTREKALCFGIPFGIAGFISLSILILCAAGNDWGNAWGILIVLIFALAASLIAFFSVKKSKDNTYINALVLPVIQAVYGPAAVYNRHGSYSRDYLRGLGVFPVNDLHQEDFIGGSFLGVPCTVCDVISTHQQSDGKNGSHTVVDFEGSVFSMKMNKIAQNRLLVSEGHTLFQGKGIQFESIEFNKMFHTSCDSDQVAFYIVTPQMEEGMIDINNSIQGTLFFLFRGEELVIIIGGHTTTFSVDRSKGLNYNINCVVDSILPMAYLIKRLNLDHKFQMDVPQETPTTATADTTDNKPSDNATADTDKEDDIEKTIRDKLDNL